jgi:hypothetical protein
MHHVYCLCCSFCYFVHLRIHSEKTKHHLKRMSTWDKICCCELPEDTSYRNLVWLLDDIYTKGVELWFCNTVVLVLL